jgi:Uma2 family endonuclease
MKDKPSMDDVIARVDLPRRRFTWKEYHRMGETGILRPSERVELIEGEIVQMAPIGHRHSACVAEQSRRLVLALGDRALVWPRNPVRLRSDTEPEPDVALLRPRPDRFTTASAWPRNTALVIEVAESSYRYDRGIKRHLYARAGVPELWIVDLVHDQVEVFRGPRRSGYAAASTAAPGDRISPEAFPDVVLDVDDALLTRSPSSSARRGRTRRRTR